MLNVVKNNRLYWIVQFVGWGAYVLITFALAYLSGGILLTQKLLLYYFVTVIMHVIASHFLRFLALKFKWMDKSIWQIIIYSLLSAVIVSTCFEMAQEFYNIYVVKRNYYLTEQPYSGAQFSINVFISFLVFSLWFGIYYAYLFIEKSRRQEIKNLQYEASRNEIELKNLRAQINPHFLFNALNSIKALVEIDKNESKDAITKLSKLLRNSIQLTKNKLISIEKELDVVTTYLDIEKIRFEDHFSIKMDIDTNCYLYKIPPLTIQTVVENAIKHGLSQSIDGGELIVYIGMKANKIIVKVSNTGHINKQIPGLGTGIKNTRKRLEIIYGDEAYFDLYEKNGMVHAYMEVKKIISENEN